MESKVSGGAKKARAQSHKEISKKSAADRLLKEHGLISPFLDIVKAVPKVAIACEKSPGHVFSCHGPEQKGMDVWHCQKETACGVSRVAAQSQSTYPTTGCFAGAGDPICDSYLAEVFQDGSGLFCIADGCGWGARAKEAAWKACTSMKTSMVRDRRGRDTHEVAQGLVRAVAEAHLNVMEGKTELDPAGSTTLLGGVALPVSGSRGLFAFVFVSVGDCKVYFRKARTGRFTDLNPEARSKTVAGEGPGGRVGPCNMSDQPDFGNLGVGCCFLERGDMLVLMTDGVYDNFDPVVQGLSSEEAGLRSSSRADWCCREMAKVTKEASPFSGVTAAEFVVPALLDYCYSLTQASRDWFAVTQTGKLPLDYKQYPGKMDHVSCLCVQF